MIDHAPLVPVILSGGTGSRLWPISRESHPKPFITLPDGQSLLQKTFLRASHFNTAAEIITITNKEYYLKSKMAYEKASHSSPSIPHTFLLEPYARNTAAAIALAALKVSETHGPDAIIFILPADHLIEGDSFYTNAEQAIALAMSNHIVTLGIKPNAPETGFGYIECDPGSTTVRGFVEKPNLETALSYLASGRFYWNSGMFCFKTSVILDEFARHAPDVLQAAKHCWELTRPSNDQPVIEFNLDSFAKLPDISIDYAIMEKSQHIAMVACDFNWQDIGSWEAYKKLFHSDQDGNTILGDVIMIDSRNNFIHSEGRMIASIGIENLAIIDTPDAMLITHRDRAQEVKHIVQTLKKNAHESYLTHRTVIRPWGTYTILEEGPSFKIKRIVVKPGASLSLQQHTHRSEHWVVVEGTAKVINGEKECLLQINESTFVPMGTPHRLSNPTASDLVIIEVQTGHYLGEDDIVRFDDTYGRVV